MTFNMRHRENSPLLPTKEPASSLFCCCNGSEGGGKMHDRQWLLGLVLALLSGVLYTANNFFIQYFEVDALEILVVRSVVQCLVLGMVLTSAKSAEVAAAADAGGSGAVASFSSSLYFLVTLQAVLGGLRLYFNFTSLEYLPLGDALTIIFTEPLFTVALSLIFLRVGIGPWKALLCLGLLLGMLLNIQPPFLFDLVSKESEAGPVDELDETATVANGSQEEEVLTQPMLHYTNDYFYGVMLALGCAICGSMCNIIISQCQSVSSLALVFHSGVGGLIIGVVGCLLDQDKDRFLLGLEALTSTNWFALLMISTIGVMAYFTMTQALKAVSPTSVSVLRAGEIVLAYVCQVAFLGQYPNLTCLAGAGLVMFSIVGIAVEESVTRT